MSTGAECFFKEQEVGEWYMHLQQYPYGETEGYHIVGPFPTFTKAHEELRHHSNPGGYSIDSHKDHVHDYRDAERRYDGEKVRICYGCDSAEPITLKCGCIDRHRHGCGEYIVSVSIPVSADSLQLLIDGEMSTDKLMPWIVAAQEKHERQIENGW